MTTVAARYTGANARNYKELGGGSSKVALLNAAAIAWYFHFVLSVDHRCGFGSLIRRSVRTAGGCVIMEPRQFRYREEMVMASSVESGLH